MYCEGVLLRNYKVIIVITFNVLRVVSDIVGIFDRTVLRSYINSSTYIIRQLYLLGNRTLRVFYFSGDFFKHRISKKLNIVIFY